MENILVTQSGRVIEVSSGGTHEATCLSKLHCSLEDFICKQNGVRVLFGRADHVAVECHDHLTSKQLSQVNKVIRENEVYSLHSCIKGIEHVKNSFRPIRGLPVEFI